MPARALTTAFLLFALTAGTSILALPAHADWSAGLAAFQAGQLDEAAREFAAIAEAQPEWYGGHLMLGQTLLRQKKASAALPHLRRAHELSNDVTSSMALAQAAGYVKQWKLVDRALAHVDPGQLETKQQASFYRLRGLSAIDGADWATAISQLQKAAQLAPNDAGLRLQLAAAAHKSDRTQLAIGHYESALRLKPNDDEVLRHLTSVRYQYAMTLDGEAKSAACGAAADEGAQLLKRPTTGLQTRLMIGLLQVCADRRQAAVATFTKTSERDPGDWQPLFHLARSHADWQQWDEAAAVAKKLERHRLEPATEAKVMRLRGRIFEGQHRFEQAIAAYESVGDEDKVARAQRSLDIQRRNQELERIQQEIDAIEEATAELDEEQKAIGGGRGLLR